jgi:Ca2+/H+ antiporter, TMEM165/GDT1 family
MMLLAHLPALLAAFFASAVEFVEALTVVLAVGAVRGWRPALTGTFAALLLLALIVLLLGPLLTMVPLRLVRVLVGILLLTFGWRWLAKAINRAAGRVPLRDEAANFARETELLRMRVEAAGIDAAAIATAFNITTLEGIEVVFIVLAIGAGAPALLPSAVAGAALALGLVMLAGLILHRPLAKVPENELKFGTGVLLVAFGIFWVGEGVGLNWPGGDGALLALIVLVFAGALGAVRGMAKAA